MGTTSDPHAHARSDPMSATLKDRVTTIAAVALAGTAQALSAVAKVAGGAASTLQPDGQDRERPARKGQERDAPASRAGTAVAESFDQRGSVGRRTQVAVPEVRHATAAPSHIAEVAGGTVADVVGRIPELSTDELRLLIEHETTHKNRKGVLNAVEQALAP